MSKINEFISNIHEYGNSKLYMVSENPNANFVLDFSIDENGDLNVTGKLEVYDSTYWDGKTINDNASLLKTIDVLKFTKEELAINIAIILYCSFYERDMYMTKEEKTKVIDTTKAENEIYSIVDSMLKLNNSELTFWIKADSNGIENMMIKKASVDVNQQIIIPITDIISDIESRVNDVRNRLNIAYGVWNAAENSRTESEYMYYSNQWNILCNDESTIINSFDESINAKK